MHLPHGSRKCVLTVIALSLALSACGGAAAPTATRPAAAPAATATAKPAPVPTATARKGPRGKVVYASGFYTDHTSDIHKFNNGHLRPLHLNIYDTLFMRNPSGEWVGRLAESWKAGDDKWEFTLKKGVKFHNGEPLTAEDVKFSFERTMAEKLYVYRSELVGKIDRVEVADETHFTVYTKQPYPILAMRMEVGAGVVPKKYVTEVGDEAFGQKPIGSGPFKLARMVRGDFTELEAFEGYFGGAPQVKTLVVSPVKESTTRVAMLKTGEADIIDQVEGPMLPDIQKEQSLRLVSKDNAQHWALRFMDLLYTDQAYPTQNLKVRQALALAIDRPVIVERIYLGFGKPAANFLNPRVLGHNPALPPLSYDVDKAKQLMKEAGYEGGFDLDFPIGAFGSGEAKLAEALQAQWAKIGVRAKIITIEQGQFTALLMKKNMKGVSVAGSSPLAFGDGEQLVGLFWADTGAFGYNPDPELKALLAQASVIVEPNQRIKKLQEVEKRLYDTMSGIPLLSTPGIFGLGPKIDWEPTAGNYLMDSGDRIRWRVEPQ